MSQNRRDLLAELKTVLEEISEVKTVRRSYTDVDVSAYYLENELPLIVIKEPAEDVNEDLTSQRDMMNLDLKLQVYFVTWENEPSSTYETLVKVIRNKIGNNFNLNNKATGMWINTISTISGELPVYWFEIGLLARYYLNEKST